MAHQTWLADFIRKLKSEVRSMYPRESYMMSFYFASEHLYGLPERSNKITLKITSGQQPYRLFAIDKFPHVEWDNTGLYSGIPYITGHGGANGSPDESLLWMSAAETFVDIVEYSPPGKRGGRLVNMITESG
jgi:mannosyl-oligosaccharide alpha-1,3-glucosidase